MELTARNTNDLQGRLYHEMEAHGQRLESRNGPVLRLPGVTTVTLRHPWEKVNFSPARDANPFFHLFEAMAMLAGPIGNNVPLLAFFAKQMMNYSDDGKQYNAFYGERLRAYQTKYQDTDQLHKVIKVLREDPNSRQALAQIWDPTLDLDRSVKDKACNLCLIFEIDQQHGWLNMTSFNRSNDAIWGGVTGANIVHLAFFQEYVACALGVQVGLWHHSSANLHVYTDNPKWGDLKAEGGNVGERLLYPKVMALFTGSEIDFDYSLQSFLCEFTEVFTLGNFDRIGQPEGGWHKYKQPFLDQVVVPMTMAYVCWKQGKKQLAYDWLKTVAPGDWCLAGLLWFKRREGINYSPHTIESHDSDFRATDPA
jgi:hypothetical protein